MGQATITTSVGVAPSKNLTIDLNGNTLSRSDSNNPIVVNPGIKLILKDSSEAGTGKVTAINNVVFIGNGGAAEFEMQSGTVEATNGVAVMVNENSSFTMNGGSVSSPTSYGVFVANGSFTMDGGSVTSTALAAIYRNPGVSFTMNGGSITSITTTYPITIYGSSDTLVINDGAITGKLYSQSPNYDIKEYITGDATNYATYDGTLYVGDSYTELVQSKTAGTDIFGPITLNGFKSFYSTADALTSAALDAGCVASVGNNYYMSLSDAIAAAQSGETVKLIADTNIGNQKITIDKNITLDLNEKTLTASGEDEFLDVAKGYTFNVDNGTIAANGNYKSGGQNLSKFREKTINLQAGASKP